jgi:hypothetical protein
MINTGLTAATAHARTRKQQRATMRAIRALDSLVAGD